MTGKKLKIALCLSGEPRSSMYCFSYIYEALLQKNSLYDVDVYIHSWKTFRALPLYNPKNYQIDSTSEDLIYAKNISKLKKLPENLQLTHESRYTLPIKNTILMYYGIQKSFELTKNEKYDFYIRCRLDIQFNNQFKLIDILHQLYNTKSDIWVKDEYIPSSYKVINDQFAVCNYKAMEVYSNAYSCFDDLIKQTQNFYPEGLLYEHLKNNNIKVFKGLCDFHLVRKVSSTIFPYTKLVLDE